MEDRVGYPTALIICTTKLCLRFRSDTIQTICYSNDLLRTMSHVNGGSSGGDGARDIDG